ncbi:MAG: radical SAM protein [Nitrospirota bacterium]
MRYFLERMAVLKWLEIPSLYQISRDDLYTLDHDSFRFLQECSTPNGCNAPESPFVDYCLDEGLLTTKKTVVPRPPLIQSPSPSLRYLELQITDACNLRCKHCYLSGGTGTELSAGQIRDILTEFQEMQGLRVLITGGEPVLHPDFNAINDMLPDFAVRKVLFTNGTLLNRKTLKTLKVDEIQVSIDGLEQSHDTLRGQGAYQQAIETARNARETGLDVSIATMVHRGNLGEFDELERTFRGLDVRDWTVDIPSLNTNLPEHQNIAVTPEEGGKYLGYGFGDGLHSSSQGHGCGFHLMAVLANGTMAKCTFYGNHPIGTLEQGLRVAWKNLKPVLLKDIACRCDYLEICRGGCRYRGELLEGKRGRDLYRCMFYGILESQASAIQERHCHHPV